MSRSVNRSGRRQFIKTAAGGLVLAQAAPLALAQGKQQIVVSDPGGPYSAAYRRAFYDPFEKATGIRVVNVAREAQPVAQISAIVKSRNYIWDVTTLTLSADIPYLEANNLLEPIGINPADYPQMIPDSVQPNWLGVDVYATVMAYRTDKFPGEGPKTWADFWNVEKFPGRRSLRRNPLDTLEQALMADGVPVHELYPLDVDRAFRSLEKIKPHISIWWTSGAQAMQIIQNGDVDMVSTWNARAQTAIENGAPVKIVWNEGLYSIEGWGIPRGTPRAEMAKQFVLFCADARRQASFTEDLPYGPTNTQAMQFIPPERAAVLPSAPENLRNMALPSPEWWAVNRQAVTERFNNFLIS
ncbi:ABC transporter substrate-binding protein [Kerstersia gyiorum]|uniref:ABC transporter substrate-binding protein n=1 Tax=Kerstersia gyiorum TaxID=206506 RepID=UPI0021505B41|nr:ABC transporter substrate-binding protein [Kerstersia gyiorum]MCR4157800.1 ABC transporter substrate-binding protein [Kerstersia gyiorum]